MRYVKLLTIGCLWVSGAGAWAGTQSQTLPSGVAAIVNGQSIKASNVDATLRKDVEPELHDQIREQHLQRMVAWAIVEQALAEHKLAVTDKDVEREVAQMTKAPPLLSCGCCGYQSLDEYLQVNRMSDEDLRLDIKRDLGLGLLVQDAWKSKHTGNGEDTSATRGEVERYRQHYRKVWQIFTAAPEEVPETPASAEKSKQARKKLQQALDELSKGASFQDIAKSYSQDASTAAKGGLLGYMPIDQPLLGLVDSKRWPGLELGKVHGPYRSWAGYHVIRIEALSDEDARSVMKAEFEAKATDEIWGQLLAQAHVEPASLLK